MTTSCRAVVVACAMTGCGYWSAGPRGDVAPSAWGATARGADAPNASTRRESVEARLSNLEHLRKEGIISAEEYRERRRSVLADAFD
jgi:hypothetical protein